MKFEKIYRQELLFQKCFFDTIFLTKTTDIFVKFEGKNQDHLDLRIKATITFPAFIDFTLKKAPSSSSRKSGCLSAKLDRAFLTRDWRTSRERKNFFVKSRIFHKILYAIHTPCHFDT